MAGRNISTGWTTSSPTDPFNTANNTPKSAMETRTITSNDYRVLSSGDLSYNILPGLDFKTMGSIYMNYTQGLDFAKRNSNREGYTFEFIIQLKTITINQFCQFNDGIYLPSVKVKSISEKLINFFQVLPKQIWK